MRLMRWIAILFIFLVFMSVSWGNDTYRAQKNVLKALAQTQEGKKIKKEIKRMIKNNVSEEALTPLSILAVAAYRAEIKTDQIKNLDIDILGLKIRPDMSHNFRSNDTRLQIGIDIVF